ncbi:AEC family transporter [Maliponia aquimaris]|uniref:Membrane transport protein n=1 Tax=Maliponia aquimaris TaxID=1673631 RepID=A0A238K0I6_9RHOB|nr:AEC family transporter [Maliponia aquimaris]SMX36409.1 Membrane transport protein [Maliponia aquimaris]
MLVILTHDILPVFSMLALGMILGRTGRVQRDEATTVNRVAFLVLQPALIFTLISAIDWQTFRADALGGYVLAQVVLFTLTYLLCRRLFGREPLESWLLAMATIFVNTLLYIWPISVLIYGEALALPVTAIAAWDSAVSFSFFIVTTDLMANPGAGPGRALRRIAGNPVLIAIALGLTVSLAGLTVPEPILTACRFAGAGAAPLTLLALGVILSGQALTPTPLVATIAGLKLLAFPLLAAAALWAIAPPEHWETLFILTAAGPSGAMAFALALLHRVRTDAIAPVIVWTSLLSLFSLAWLA